MMTAALALAACGDDKPAESAQPNTEASANTATATASNQPVVAASGNTATASSECVVVVNSDDKMMFDMKEINVKSSCKEFTITLKHTGTMPKAGMGHNVVITKASDKNDVISDGSAAGSDKDYLKPDDTRIVAATKLIGGGETDTITFPVNKLAKDENYVFFCSFPGHAAMMTGKVNLVD